MVVKSLSIGVLAAAAGLSNGAIYFESEPNDSLATADFIGAYSFPGDGIVVDGRLTAGDVDWFRFTLNEAAPFVGAALYDLAGSAAGNDGVMGLFDSGGGLIAYDDDGNLGFMPSIEAFSLSAGDYYFAVSGFPDDGFVGDHEESFGYKLIIGINIPAPGTAGVLALGGLVAVRRRR